ncbi:DNA replication protein, partial [Sinorhizobium medicae]
MSISAAIRRMLEAGLTIEQALVAAEAFEAEAETVPAVDRAAVKRRAWDRERKRKQRNSALSAGSPVETGGQQVDSETLSSPEVSPHT